MTKTIFLIDDDAEDRLLFQEALAETTLEFALHTAENGRIAFRKLHNKEIALPDLIFLDVNMPIADGWQCLSVLKKEKAFKEIPVIMYSTSSHPEDVEKALTAGALCFFTKPYDYKELRRTLELVVDHLISNTLDALVNRASSFAAVPHS